MKHRARSLLLGLGVATILALASHATPQTSQAMAPADDWDWNLPAHFPTPEVPADNPMSEPKVALGRRLFYDPQLSLNQSQSCASCHQQALAFTDGLPAAVGSTGERHPRGSMSLTNVAYASRLAWANPLVDRLEHQALLPLLGETPVELGMSGQEELLLDRLEASPTYRQLFDQSFDGAQPISLSNVAKALAAFQRTLISSDSPYDRYVAGDDRALNASEKRGLELFMSERLECFHCHGGFNFSDAVDHQKAVAPTVAFHNNGLYNLDGRGAYPATDTGVEAVTGNPDDMGRFKAPTLRNIALTAPYMHDGSLPTLEAVIAHYARGGGQSTQPAGPHGFNSPLKSEFVTGFLLTPAEQQDLLAFLRALTDPTFLSRPEFGDPFAQPEATP